MKLARPKPPRPYAQTSRAQSAEETGRRITNAFIARLMTHWFDQITLDLIAADAGVTVQTVIRRFGGKEGLLDDAAGILTQQINAQRGHPSNDVAALVNSLYTDYERTGDTVIRLLALEPRHPAIQRLTAVGRREHRQWIADALAEALGKLKPSARQRALDALVVATDVYMWKLLRRDMGRSLSAAKATTTALVNAAISQNCEPVSLKGETTMSHEIRFSLRHMGRRRQHQPRPRRRQKTSRAPAIASAS